jgi:arylsulfatase A-like enzyme
METGTNGGRPSAKNLLFIMSDEHTRSVLGCYGNRVVHTPNLDQLAAEGTRFTNAYTPSPVCVSARASLATGRWVHDTGAWSSAEPYDGTIPGWGHRLIDAGHRVASVGKLHYRQTGDPNGFDEELLPLHVVGGVGWADQLQSLRPTDLRHRLRLAAANRHAKQQAVGSLRLLRQPALSADCAGRVLSLARLRRHRHAAPPGRGAR